VQGATSPTPAKETLSTAEGEKVGSKEGTIPAFLSARSLCP